MAPPLLLKQRVIVDVGAMAVSNGAQVVLSTYALGSCIGVVAYDPASRTGGMLHLMLPNSASAPERAAVQPSLCADTALPHFFRQMAGLNAKLSGLRLLVAGGARVVAGLDSFRIGEMNTEVTLAYLKRREGLIRCVDVGGIQHRTLHLELSSGTVSIKTPLAETRVNLAA